MGRARYRIPDDVAPEQRRKDAQKRRDALRKAGCATFELGHKGGQPSIVCLCCGLGSCHPEDIRNLYCGFCRAWHSLWMPAKEQEATDQ